jgi:hypothetical protein
MATPREQFIIETRALKQAAGVQWDRFVEAFAAFAQAKCEEAVQAPLPVASVAQGHAQALLALKKDFRDLEATYSQVATKLKSR